MKEYFVILVDQMSAECRDAVTDHVREAGYAWWHWFPDAWLIVAEQGQTSTIELRDVVKELAPDGSVLVFQASGGKKWAGWMDPEKMEWLSSSWT